MTTCSIAEAIIPQQAELRPSVVLTIASLEKRSGGPSRVVTELADALVASGLDVSLVFGGSERSTDDVLPAKATACPTGTLRFRNRALWTADYAGTIRTVLKTTGPQLIHDNGLWSQTNFVAARFAASQGIPLIISPHGMLEPWALSHRRARKTVAMFLYQRALLEAARLFVVTSDSEWQSIRRAGFRQPVAVVPPGIAMPRTRAQHDPQACGRRILFLSRLHPVKGLLPFIDAWQQARRPGWKVIVAGPDEAGHRADIERHLQATSLTQDFEFVGEVAGTDKQSLFESADLFVLPSFSENFGVAIAEAMAYGLPVLTTQGTPWSVLERIRAGWWVEVGKEGLINGLRRALATDSQERAAMGSAGRTYAQEQLGWSRAARHIAEAYDWTLGSASHRPAHIHLD